MKAALTASAELSAPMSASLDGDEFQTALTRDFAEVLGTALHLHVGRDVECASVSVSPVELPRSDRRSWTGLVPLIRLGGNLNAIVRFPTPVFFEIVELLAGHFGTLLSRDRSSRPKCDTFSAGPRMVRPIA